MTNRATKKIDGGNASNCTKMQECEIFKALKMATKPKPQALYFFAV